MKSKKNNRSNAGRKIAVTILGSAVVSAAVLAAPAPVAPLPPAAPVPATGATRPSPRPATMPIAERNRKTIEILLVRGADAIALGEYKVARDCFVDVIQLDPKNRPALESLGFCYVKLDDLPRATRSMEAAVAVPIPAGRELTLNLAFSLLRNRNPMRGAKIIKDYLSARPGVVDEEALNAFAICLGQASDEAKLNRFWTECTTFFEQYTAKLEATRADEKRWGIEWIPKSEWMEKDKKNKAVQKQMDAKWAELARARDEYSQAKKQYDQAVAASRFGNSRGPSPASIAPRVERARNKTDKLQSEHNEIAAGLLRPTLPKLFEAVPLPDSAVMVASAGGTGSAGNGGMTPVMPTTPSSPSTPSSNGRPATPPRAITPPTLVAPGGGAPATPPVTVAPPAAVPETTPETPAEKPKRKRAIFTAACGFAVAPDLIVTTAASVHEATRVTVQPVDSNPIEAEVVKIDPASGLALIRLKGRRMQYLPVGDAFAGGAIQCVSFPTESIFEPTPELLSGSAVPPKENWTVRLSQHPRIGGAPLIANGKVVGVVLASRDDSNGTLPSASLGPIKDLVGVLPPGGAMGDPRMAVVMVNGVREK